MFNSSLKIAIIFLPSMQSVLSADFYGASYAVFPAFAASEYLDISLNFRTYFSDGVIMYIGSAAQVLGNLTSDPRGNILSLLDLEEMAGTASYWRTLQFAVPNRIQLPLQLSRRQPSK